MKEKSLRERILSFMRRGWLRDPYAWCNGGKIEELAMQCIRKDGSHYKASNASRRCREMASGKLSNGKSCEIVLEEKIDEGTVWYRYLPTREDLLKKQIEKVTADKEKFLIEREIRYNMNEKYFEGLN